MKWPFHSCCFPFLITTLRNLIVAEDNGLGKDADEEGGDLISGFLYVHDFPHKNITTVNVGSKAFVLVLSVIELHGINEDSEADHIPSCKVASC
ncbi:hypothetical protein FF1_016710 [Malus domestica]